MSPTDAARSRSFLVLPDAGFDWGIDAERVTQVLPNGQIRPSNVVDLPSLIAGTSRPPTVSDQAERVVAVNAEQGLCFVRSAGAMAIRHVAGSAVCDLPPTVKRGAAGRILSGVVFGDKEPPLLVVDVEELWRASAKVVKR